MITNNAKQLAERTLKSFLKNKKIGFSTVLLITFLITGGIGKASDIDLGLQREKIQKEKMQKEKMQKKETQREILNKITDQKIEIQALLAENEEKLSKLETNKFNMLRKGDYYSKPIYPSTQIFFNYNYENNGIMKDSTKRNYKKTIDAITNAIENDKKIHGISDEDYANYKNGKLNANDLALKMIQGNNGVVVAGDSNNVNVELGVSIKSLKPDVPTISRTVEFQVETPTIPSISMTAPTLSIVTFSPPPVVVPTGITQPTIGSVSVKVNAPETIKPINITAPNAPNPIVPEEKKITVETPPGPPVFEPITLVIPEEPELPVITPFFLPTPNVKVQSSGNANEPSADNKSGNMAIIHGVSITGGTFHVYRGDEKTPFTLIYDYNDYSGINTSGKSADVDGDSPINGGKNVADGRTWNLTNRVSTTSTDGKYGFLKSVANGVTYNNGTIIYSRNHENKNDYLRELVHFDVHEGTETSTVRKRLETGSTAAGKNVEVLDAYDDFEGLTGGTRKSSGRLMFVNSGTLVLEGGNISLTNQYDHTADVKSGALNTGTISIQPYEIGGHVYKANAAAFVVSEDNKGGWHVMYNGPTGQIDVWNESGFGYVVQATADNKEVSIVNRGKFSLYGENSVGIFTGSLPGKNAKLMLDITSPIGIFGDNSIGMYILPNGNGGTTTGQLAINIGSPGIGNKNFTSTTTNGTKINNMNMNPSSTNTDIEGSVGLVSNVGINLTSTDINIYDKTSNNIGVSPLNNSTLLLGNGNIKVIGGQKNVGIYVNNGNVTFSGGTVQLDDGDSNIGIYANNGKEVSLNSAVHNSSSGNAKNNILLVAIGNGSKITASNGIDATGLKVYNPVDESDSGLANENKNNSMAAFSSGTGAMIDIHRNALPAMPNIEVIGAQVKNEAGNFLGKYRGVALMATTKSSIDAQYNNIKVINGSAGVAAMNSASIDLRSSQIEVNKGYGLFSDGTGTIDFRNGMLILDNSGSGNATIGLDIDLSSPVIKMDLGTRIHVKNDNVIIANLKNVATTLKYSTLAADIRNQLGGINVTSDAGVDNYLEAAIDNSTINIDNNMDKTNSVTDPTSKEYFYYRRFLAQRSKINVNSDITGELTNAQSAFFRGQVVGVEMSSSKAADPNGKYAGGGLSDTQINISNGATIKVGRTDSGAGAIGAYINFGIVTNNGIINVENSFKNDGGVGIYATNGAIVDNKNTIEVYGNKGMGILGTAYRKKANSSLAGKEFGGIAGEGATTIKNDGNITTYGEKSIGIYMLNNSADIGLQVGVRAENTTNARINALGKSAVGIYAKGNGVQADTIVKNNGTIEVGENGIGIFVENAVDIQKIGTLELGTEAIGVVLDKYSKISDIGTITATGKSTGNKMVIAIKSDNYGINDPTGRTLALNIDASGLVQGTAMYILDSGSAATTINSTGNLHVGADGVGIYLENGHSTNTGNITLVNGGINAIGMYTKNGNIVNGTLGTIDVNSVGQVALMAKSSNGQIENNGTINLNADNTTGIYIKDKAILNKVGTINFNGQKSFGIVVDDATIIIGSKILKMKNDDENIYIYGTGGSIVKLDGDALIDGVVNSVSKKSVGFYLDNTGKINVIDGNGKSLKATNGIIGMYSKENNTIKDINIGAFGDETVGVYYTNGGTLDNSSIVTAANIGDTAIGIYGLSGDINIGSTLLSMNLYDSSYSGAGTGAYLRNGARLTGSKEIVIDNLLSNPLGIGLYYTKGNSSSVVIHDTALSLNRKVVGLYADGGIQLEISKNISQNGADTVGAYVSGNSKFVSKGIDNINSTNNVGVFAGDGEGINNGTINLTNAAVNSVGMVARGNTAGNTAKIMNNTGKIINVSNGIGMLIGDTVSTALGISEGYNKGIIDVQTGNGAGVVVSGLGNNRFDGTGGTIKLSGTAGNYATGLYLDGTSAGQVIGAGTLNLLNQYTLGIFAKNAVIDFNNPIEINGANGGVGVYAEKGSTISSDIDASASKDTIAVYLSGSDSSDIKFSGNKEIKTGMGSAIGKTAIGLLLDKLGVTPYLMDGVNLYANGTGSIAVAITNGTIAEFNNMVTVENGAIGVYVGSGSTYDGIGGKLNLGKDTIGIYVDGGTGYLGVSGGITINFTGSNAIAIYNKNGTINLGNNITAIGAGSLAGSENGSVINSGNILVSDGAIALIGTYTAGGPYRVHNTATGTVIGTNGGIALAALGIAGSADVKVKNDGTITISGKNVSGNPAIGLYTTLGEIDNIGTINTGVDAIGILSNTTGRDIKSTTINLTGTNSIGIFAEGNTGNIKSNTINAIADKTVGIYFKNVISSVLDLGNIKLLDDSMGLVVSESSNIGFVNGNITVGDTKSNNRSAVGIYAETGGKLTLSPTTTITAGNGAIALVATGIGSIIDGVNVSNLKVGADGVYLYAGNGGKINITTGGTIEANNNIGLMVDGRTGGNITGAAININVKNGGVGAYFDGSTAALSTINVAAGSVAKYSIGAIYKDINGTITLPTIVQNGSYTIGAVLENTSATLASPISLNNAADKHQIGLVSKGMTGSPVTLNLGTINVMGDDNIGIFGEYTDITSGAITVGNSTSTPTAAVGAYINNGSLRASSVMVGDKSIGVYGEKLNAVGIQISGPVSTGKYSVGIYGNNTEGGTGAINVSGNITVARDRSIGIYGENADITATLAPTDQMTVGANTSVGILSSGNGDVTFSGNSIVANKGNDAGSIAIYKIGNSGKITTNGNINIGNGGYGVYIESTMASSIVLNNNANMILGESAVGIFAEGTVSVLNKGNIDVGTTYLGVHGDHKKVDEHENSVGIYLMGGAKGINAPGVTIKVDENHSVGVYASGSESSFTNNGIIEVSNGGIGIFVTNGATAINSSTGVITIKNPSVSSSGEMAVGIAAYGGNIINHGIINAYDGIGILLGATGNTLVNTGTINIHDGIGINGNISGDTGNLVINGTGTGVNLSDGNKTVGVGDVKITDDNKILINDKYVSIGGTLTSSKPIILGDPFVDITHFNPGVPLFNAPDVNGSVKLTSNFATIGNGYLWKVEDFVKSLAGTGSKITVSTSPLFLAKVDERDGSLIVAKEAYSTLVIGDQFDALYDGLDSILRQSGLEGGTSSNMLKALNAYLDSIYQSAGADKSQFYKETARTLAETRGDVYSTIQQRMQNVQSSFSDSFYELLNSYNKTKESRKYSVIYTQGDFKDNTIGIDDYNYRVHGLYYMEEHEGKNYGNKSGYSFGFAASRFSFDDGPTYGSKSKEDVYSIRAGMHGVKNFNDTDSFRLISRLEIGYNNHRTERVLELNKTYKNKGEYNSYQVKLDNRLEKTLLRTVSSKIDVYAGINAEYGKFDKFTEKAIKDSGLTLDIKGDDYISIRPEIGISGTKRMHLGKKLSAKLFGDLSYAHELGDYYKGNKARISEGTEGYYVLPVIEKEKGIIKGDLGIGFEKANHYGITFDVGIQKHDNKKNNDLKFNVKFNYKFNS
jgi:hypothetical protein